MNLVVLTGSPHKNGTSALLAERFIQGAAENGHEIFRFDCAFAQVHPCIGCDVCDGGKHPCAFADDMQTLYPRILHADLVAFVTPLYYHAMSAQLKAVFDRLHAIDPLLHGGKKAVLLASAADTRPWVMEGLAATYETNLKFLQWQDCGKVLAGGSYHLQDLLKTDFPQQAYLLGKSL